MGGREARACLWASAAVLPRTEKKLPLTSSVHYMAAPELTFPRVKVQWKVVWPSGGSQCDITESERVRSTEQSPSAHPVTVFLFSRMKPSGL